MKYFKIFTEIIGWLQIVASPFLAGLAIGFFVYLSKPDMIGIVIAISITVIGLLAGMFWATNIWKKKGTVNFMTAVRATPDLDERSNTETK